MCNYYTDCRLWWTANLRHPLVPDLHHTAAAADMHALHNPRSAQSWHFPAASISSVDIKLEVRTVLPPYPNNTTDSVPSICFPLHMSVFFHSSDQKSDWFCTGAMAAAQSGLLSHLQLFHSSVHTWAVYSEIKRLFNCNGIGVLLP